MALKDASRETRLQWFARQIIDATWQGGDVCGSDVQGWAKSAGLILEHTVTDADYKAAQDGVGGRLAEISDGEFLRPGDTYYTFGPDIAVEAVDWKQMTEMTPGAREGASGF